MGAIATLIISYIFLIYGFQTVSFFSFISQSIQPYCINLFNQADYASLLQAFFCGQPLSEFYYIKTLQQSGVYHVLVVSGFHLSLVRKPINYLALTFNKSLEFLLLTLYALLTGFNPPVVRSLIEAIIPLKHPTLRILISWLGCLALSPLWILSPSLHLSLSARIAIELSQPYRSPLALPLIIFLTLLPLILSSHPMASWLSILSTPLLTFSLMFYGASHLLLNLGELINFAPLAMMLDFIETLAMNLLDKTLKTLQLLGQLQGGLNSLRLLSANLSITYLCGLMTYLQFTIVKRNQNKLSSLPIKTPKSNQKIWVFLFFIFFVLTPIPIKKDKLKKTKRYTVDILSLDPWLQAHNIHTHHKH